MILTILMKRMMIKMTLIKIRRGMTMTIMVTMTRRRMVMTALPTSSSVLCGLTASFRSRRLFSFAELDLKSLLWYSWSSWSSSSPWSPAIFLLFPVDRSIEEEKQLVQNILSARLLFHLVVIIVIMMKINLK